MSTGRLIGVLFVGALLTVLLRWLWVESEAPQSALRSASDPGAEQVVEGLQLRVLNEDGSPHFLLNSERLVQSAGDGSAVLTDPELRIYKPEAETWRATSTSAWMLEDGSEVRMNGNAVLEQGQSLRIESQTMTLFPYDDRARSDVETTVTEPGSVITGVGMRADLVREFYRLLDNVRGNYDPTQVP